MASTLASWGFTPRRAAPSPTAAAHPLSPLAPLPSGPAKTWSESRGGTAPWPPRVAIEPYDVAAASSTEGMNEEEDHIASIVKKVQARVFKRRIRAKEPFVDFDPLRSGRCTAQQFKRAILVLVPDLLESESEALVAHFADDAKRQPQVVSYSRFARAVEQVFTVPELERSPTAMVPKPGESLLRSAASGATAVDGAFGEDPRLDRLLRKLALLVKTRGIVFKSCFQDCERSDSTSLVNPRFGGKVTTAQFRKYFPFLKEFSEAEVDVLAKRYSTSGGDVRFMALDKDICELNVDTLDITTRTSVRLAGLNETEPHIGRRAQPKEAASCEEVLEKLRAVISARRLRVHDRFHDFDQLRRGLCRVHQVHAVFSMLGMEVGPEDVDVLSMRYLNHQGLFRYKDLCRDLAVDAPPLTTRSAAPSMISRPGDRLERLWTELVAPDDASLDLLETQLSKRIQLRSLPLKAVFQDFDRTNTGRVTRSQFTRALAMLSIELSEKQVDLLCGAYCDAGKQGEFKYLDFCAAVDIRAHWNWGASSAHTPSKYFGRNGVVQPMEQRPITY